MNFASEFVNLDYDSDEDDLELSETEFEQGFDVLDLDVAAPQQALNAAAPQPPRLADVNAASNQPPMQMMQQQQQQRHGGGSLFSSLSKRLRPSSSSSSRFAAAAAPPPSLSGAPGAPPMPPPLQDLSFGAAPPPPSMAATKPKKAVLLANREQRQELRRQKHEQRRVQPKKQRRRQHVNTNVVSVSLGTLSKGADKLATGDPVFCAEMGCRCMFSSVSKLRELQSVPKAEGGSGKDEVMEGGSGKDEVVDGQENENKVEEPMLEEGQRIWDCEFCGKVNVVDIEDEEMPEGDSQDYILEPAAAMEDGDKKAEDERLIIFCIDISGSMCVSREVAGKFKLKGDRLADLARLNVGGEDQFMPNQRRNTTWVSRLQAVQAAVDAQLEQLEKTCPNYRVGLVTFNGEVTIYGDGQMETEVVTGDKLLDLTKLQEVGKKCSLEVPISKSRPELEKKLFGLEETGPTALGPALAVSCAMASVKNGSKVILCTDGMANVGVGKLDESTDQAKEEAENWYEGIGNFASMSGVTVDVISISDDQCRLENIGRVADMTSGKVDKIDILEITSNFAGILQNPVIATNVNATMLVHRGLRLRTGEEDETPNQAPPTSSSSSSSSQKGSQPADGASSDAKKKFVVDRVSRDIGNVTSETEVFFEYSIRKEQVDQWKGLPGLPFQVQIQYTRLDGSRCVRTLSQIKEVTLSKEKAEGAADVGVLAAAAAQKSAQLAQKGDYESSRAVNFGNALYMDRIAQRGSQQRVLSRWARDVRSWDQAVHQEQQSEVMAAPALSSSSKPMKMKGRSRRRADHVSKAMFGMKQKRRYSVEADDESDSE